MIQRGTISGNKIRRFFYFIISFICLSSISVSAQSIKDLEEKLKSASADEKPGILNQLAEEYLATDPDKCIDYAEQALKAARKADDINEEAGALINLGDGYKANKNQKKALQNYKEAIKIFDKYNQTSSSAYIWNKIADLYIAFGNTTDAIDADNKALELFKMANDKSGIVSMNIELGDIYFNQKKYDGSIPFYKTALKLYEDSHDARGQVTILSRIGTAYSNWGNFDEAYMFLSRALDLAKKNNLNSLAKEIEKNLDVVKNNMSGYQKSQTEFAKQKEQQTQEEMKTKEMKINSLAQQNVKSLEEIEQMNEDAQLKEFKIKAQSDEITRKKMEADSQEKANELLTKESELQELELNKQKLIIWGAIGFSALVVLLTVFIFIAYRNKKKSNDLLKQKNDVIYKQKEQIVQKNILITDSIDYAKNIQDAILPSEKSLATYFPESFILNKPKDIVSGDFYWFHEEKEKCFCIAAADCTGHGVPGAFMSLLGFIMLDDIVKRSPNGSPGEVLKEVNTELMETLHQDAQNTTGKFGMDIALVKYDLKKKEITYAGAHNPLIIIKPNGEIVEVKADKISIGTTTECSFNNNVIPVSKGDYIYIYSDGFQDQIGGEKRKKFLAFHLKELLQQIHTLAPEKQREELDRKHMEWRSKTEQTDDILIIGIKV